MTHIATSYTSLNKNIDKLSLKIKPSLYGRLRGFLERIEFSCDNALFVSGCHPLSQISITQAVSCHEQTRPSAKPCVVMATKPVKSTFLQRHVNDNLTPHIKTMNS